jgi:hypothetical protein
MRRTFMRTFLSEIEKSPVRDMRSVGPPPFRCVASCRSTRVVRDRAKSRTGNRTTMRSVARAPHYRRAERLLRRRSGRWCGASPVSSAAYGPTPPFPKCSPMSIDAGCGRSRMGPHSCSTTWGTSGAHKGITSGGHFRCTEVCVGADNRVSPFTWGSIYPGFVVLAPATVILHNGCFITGGAICGALSCRGVQTHVNGFYPHGQSVVVKMYKCGTKCNLFILTISFVGK